VQLEKFVIKNSEIIEVLLLGAPTFVSLSFVGLSYLKAGLLAYSLLALTFLALGGLLFACGAMVYAYCFTLRKLRIKVFSTFISKLELTGNESILDIESFRGIFPNLLAKITPNAEVTALVRSKNRWRKKCKNIEIKQFDLWKIPFPDHSFDVVTSTLFFHKISIPQVRDALLVEILRVLKPNGQLVLCDLLLKSTQSYNKQMNHYYDFEPKLSLDTLPFEYYLKYICDQKITMISEHSDDSLIRCVVGRQMPSDAADLSAKISKEAKPPWVVFPGFGPSDGFWRQSGEGWFYFVWRPYWDSLSDESQKKYLEKYEVPQEW
jgi:ubiquinone/menaquinone biosynthesis C-methylase UbiE